nr:hypothetical protein Iba_chr12dCG4970 [Ipomoea batatas]
MGSLDDLENMEGIGDFECMKGSVHLECMGNISHFEGIVSIEFVRSKSYEGRHFVNRDFVVEHDDILLGIFGPEPGDPLPIDTFFPRNKLPSIEIFTAGGKEVPEKRRFPRFTVVTFFPCESQVINAQFWHASFPFQDWASVIGYPKPPAMARSAVTCGSQDPVNETGTTPVNWLSLSCKSNRFRHLERSGMGPVLKIRERIEEIWNGSRDTGVAGMENIQVCAFDQIAWNLPWAEISILGNAESLSDMFANEGKDPEKKLPRRKSDRRDASCVSSEGISPEMDWESRLMETTLPVDLAHSTLVHVQWSLEMDQPEGAGEIAAKSLDMTVASSENERERKLRKNSKR